MFILSKRPCKIGPSINTRTERHGDDSVPAMDIPLSEIMLTKEELNEILGEPFAHRALFSERGDKLMEPLFKNIKPLALVDKFEDCSVALYLGLKAELLSLENVKMAKVTLQPLVGGLTELTLQIQCTPEIDDGVTHLLAFLNHSADVELRLGAAPTDDTQPELPINAEAAETAPTRRSGRNRKDDQPALN